MPASGRRWLIGWPRSRSALAGMVGVYVLAQVCVVATYWCVFALGRAIAGPTHAAMAVLLMVGISLFTVPSPDFGPPILAMALWAAVLLQYWRAAIRGERRSWYALGVAAALLLLSSDAALLLLGALIAVHAQSPSAGAPQHTRSKPGSWRSALVPLSLPASRLARRPVPAASGHALVPTLARLRDADARRRQHDAVAAAACSPHPRSCRARHPLWFWPAAGRGCAPIRRRRSRATPSMHSP